MDQPTSKEINRLLTILSIANIAAFDVDHPDCGVKNRRLEECTCRKPNDHDGAARTNILGGLLEGLLRDSEEEDCVGSKTSWCSSFYLGDEIAGFGEVDVGL